MKQIWSIAKVELSMLFFSPIAWLIIVLFSFQCYQQFSATLVRLVADQDLYGSTGNLTFSIFAQWGGLFRTIQGNLYLYIPLLTMGLMSRDLSSGSIRLLYSSPVSPTQIVAGKFLSIMLFSLILIATLLPDVLFAAHYVEHPDLPLILSGMLGLTLLIWAYAAIGLFMSSLTNYQVVAALLTLGMLTLLERIGSTGQSVAFLRDLTYWASISGRTDTFIEGLLSTEDIGYFLLVIALFLAFSVFGLQYRKDRRRGRCAAKYAGALAAALLLGYATSRPGGIAYYDATHTKVNTLTPTSREILARIDGPLHITTYVNMSDYDAWMGAPSSINDDIKRFKPYMRFKPDIRMEYVYYYDEPYNNYDYGTSERIPTLEMAQKFAQGFDMNFDRLLTPEQIRARIDLTPEKNGFVRQLTTADGQSTFLRIFEDMTRMPDEQEISAAIRRLVERPVQAGFLTGHGERSIVRNGDGDYAGFTSTIKNRQALVNQGFDVREVNLLRGDSLAELDLLVIADPRRPLEAAEQAAVERYIDRGGNLLLAVEPDRSDCTEELLHALGIVALPGTLVEPGRDFVPTLIRGEVTGYGPELSYLLIPGAGVSMPTAAGLDYRLSGELDVTPLAVSPETGCWNERTAPDPAALGPADSLHADPDAGEWMRCHNLALALTRPSEGGEQRIVVLGDADCLSNMELTVQRKELTVHNQLFCSGLFAWLSQNRYPVDVRRASPEDNVIHLTPDQMAPRALLLKWLIPALLTAVGCCILWLRLRR